MGLPRVDESLAKDATRRGYRNRRVQVDIDIEEILVSVEEFFPQGSEREIRIREEEESDFGFGIYRSQVRDRGNGMSESGGNGRFVEENKIVEIVGKGETEVVRREDLWGEEEDKRKREQQSERDNQRGCQHLGLMKIVE